MKELIKNILKRFRVYHPLQLFYRTTILNVTNWYYRIAYSRYRGKGFICNACHVSYSEFVPNYPDKKVAHAIKKNKVVAGYGRNVYCPNCMSKNRERLVLAYLQNMFEVRSKKVLHISPEKNVYRFLKSRGAEVTTVDYFPGFYKHIDPNIAFADATKLNFAENQYDLVIANHILEHIPDDVRAMQEFYRVLKNSGLAILQVPYSTTLVETIEEPWINDPERQELLFGQRDHVRLYSYADYISRLEKSGFTVHVLGPGELQQFRQYAIQENECLFLCYKKGAAA